MDRKFTVQTNLDLEEKSEWKKTLQGSKNNPISILKKVILMADYPEKHLRKLI